MDASYNPDTELTTFRSGVTTNNSADPGTVTGDRYRVRVTFDEMSTFRISMGSDSGLAYFGLQFAAGPQWADEPDVTETPVLDLDTETAGIGRSATFKGTTPVAFTSGGQNIEGADGGVSHLIVRFPEIAEEGGEIGIDGASAGETIGLDFGDGDSVPNVVLNGVTYAVEATISDDDQKRLTFTSGSGGAFSRDNAEDLLDALRFDSDTDSVPGTRVFGVSVIDGVFQSRIAEFTIFAVIDADANGSEISVDEEERIAGEEEALIQVQLRDEDGNVILQPDVNVQFSTTLGQLNEVGPTVTVQTDENGLAEAVLGSASTGTAEVTAKVEVDGVFEDVSRGGSADNGTVTVTFIAGAADAGESDVVANPTSVVADGTSTSTITVTLFDANGNALSNGGDDVFLTTDLGSLGPVSDEDDGTYTANAHIRLDAWTRDGHRLLGN